MIKLNTYNLLHIFIWPSIALVIYLMVSLRCNGQKPIFQFTNAASGMFGTTSSSIAFCENGEILWEFYYYDTNRANPFLRTKSKPIVMQSNGWFYVLLTK